MVGLDFLSCITAFVTVLLINESNAVVMAGCVLTVLSILGAFESPTVQAVVPQMQEGDNIIRANAAVNQVAALAGLIAPFLGSALYTIFGLRPVLAVSVGFFFLTAVLEVFIRLPYHREETNQKWTAVIKEDFQVVSALSRKISPKYYGCFWPYP